MACEFPYSGVVTCELLYSVFSYCCNCYCYCYCCCCCYYYYYYYYYYDYNYYYDDDDDDDTTTNLTDRRPVSYEALAVCNCMSHVYGNSHAIWDHTVLPATRQR